ncbi:SurA N-terminal domain-containing protein [Cognatishimia sp. SS12]|uniref:peptidylprolyl isomerase n=1 Tax=Cognatishimia sp. SS12 TaxID=2979465 RepID=UPI00232D003C|nr:peptidylprolyl isomerase [Cognatishimia sp. SS12]MDC0737431.1 SurA N-terminal domain-containing protein [Cognatishimia sp. SS12]
MSEKRSISKSLMWVLMGLLIFGLGGFGITNLGGAVQSVGSVDGKDIEIDAYYRAVQDQLSALQAQTGQRITFTQAQAFGLDRQILGTLVAERALDAEAERLGLSMGDENLRREVLSIPAFQSLDGSFDREAYRFALQNSGMNETEFENSLREDAARGLLQSAIVGGVEMPRTYANALLAYLGEQRSFTMAILGEAQLETEIGTADEATLKTFYDENIEAFMRPATRDITYVALVPSMLIDSVEIDDATLKAEYDARDAEFNQPERRLVERLVFGTSEEAANALADVTAGETSFEDLVEARGLTLADVDLGDLSADELSDASVPVFAAETGEVVGPIQTDLGPALFRVNAVLEAQNVSFEEALPQLRDALALDRARRVIDAQINDIDDLLAGGASLEDVAAETDMELGTINFHAGSDEDIAGYAGFRQVAQTVTEEDFPQIEQLEDGGIYALRLDGTTDAAPAPFDAIKDEVQAAWQQDALNVALSAQANAIVAEMNAGTDIIALGLPVFTEQQLTRGGFVPDAPEALLDTVFEMTEGEVRTLNVDGRSFVIELDAIAPADMENPENATLANLVAQQSAQALAQDIFQAYSNHIRAAADIEIDQHALAAVHAQLQ